MAIPVLIENVKFPPLSSRAWENIVNFSGSVRSREQQESKQKSHFCHCLGKWPLPFCTGWCGLPHIFYKCLYFPLSLFFLLFFPLHSLSSTQIVIQEPRATHCLASGLSHGLKLPPILQHGLGNLFIFCVLEIDLVSCQGLAWVLQKEHWQIFMEPKVKLKTLLK